MGTQYTFNTQGIYVTSFSSYLDNIFVYVYILRHVTHNYIINFIEGLFPLVSEAHCGYDFLHEYVITIISFLLTFIPECRTLFRLSLGVSSWCFLSNIVLCSFTQTWKLGTWISIFYFVQYLNTSYEQMPQAWVWAHHISILVRLLPDHRIL